MIVLYIFLWVLLSSLIAFLLKKGSGYFTKISTSVTAIAIGLYSIFRFASGYTGGFLSVSNIALSKSAGIYQLVVHAFFKALLFLSAGAILIALLDLRENRQYSLKQT